MAGHSHWANISHKKGIADAKRGKVFSKLSRYIIIAARHGGGDPDTNLKLRYAIDKARSVSMPRENIERAIKRGTGELGGDIMEELGYEGFGPGRVAVYVDAMTDNRNRTNGEIRKLFERSGGTMGDPGCVGYMFSRRGVILVDAKTVTEDTLMNIVLEAGAEDMNRAGDHFEVLCEVGVFAAVQDALQKAGITPISAEMSMVPKAGVNVDLETGKRIIRLMEALDDHEDVSNVFTNANLTEEMMNSD